MNDSKYHNIIASCKRVNWIILLLVAHLTICTAQLQAQKSRAVNGFISELEIVRGKLKIPGMAVAVMQGDSLLFARGFGYADVQKKIKVTSSTSFRVASVTKTFTSTLIMQLVAAGKLDLDAPISKYGLDLGNNIITVRQLLTHTSEGRPGSYFSYNGYRYGRLGPVIEQITGIPFYRSLMEKIIIPAGMNSSAPAISINEYFDYVQQKKEVRPFFENAFNHLAKAYEVNPHGQVVETSYLNEFGAFGGLATTVNDLLKYSRAIDQHKFVTGGMQEQIFTPNRTNDGSMTPYGLGWFTQRYGGTDFYWHYGQTQGESAIFIKVPAYRLTFVAMANTDKLSQPFPLGDGDLLMSPLGQLVYRYFINEGKKIARINYSGSFEEMKAEAAATDFTRYKDFYNKEIIVQATMQMISGDTSQNKSLYRLYALLNFKDMPHDSTGQAFVSLRDIPINKETSTPFTATEATKFRVHGAGENCSGDFSFWCDYGWIEDSSGKKVWEMPGKPSKPAGGAKKNQQVDVEIVLPAGSYTLHYKSDGGHAFNNWDSVPPDNFFWGIELFKK